MGRRLAYTLLGFSIGLLVAFLLGAAVNKHFGIGAGAIGLAVACGAISVGIAERKGRVKSIEELNRPLTLVPPSSTIRSNEKSN
jgi:hypothetical protein